MKGGVILFSDFRHYVKSELKKRGITYAELSSLTELKESTIKCFMCGRDDSRRIAEKIADALGVSLVYRNRIYRVDEK